jgi:hypothetical protein
VNLCAVTHLLIEEVVHIGEAKISRLITVAAILCRFSVGFGKPLIEILREEKNNPPLE